MKLYKIINGIGTYWVVANDPTQAEQKLLKLLNDADYGFSSQRPAQEIHVIAEAADDTRFITNKFFIP